MKKIKQVIVVEGQNDINKVQTCVHCDCIKTNGTHLSNQILNQLKEINKTRGIIVFTDDDYPGRLIRSRIQEALGTVEHAYIDKKVSSTSKKTGVEHASCEDILNSLSNVMVLDDSIDSFPYTKYIELGLVTNHQKRNQLIKQLGLPPMNSKRFFKVLNQMNISPQELKNNENNL